MRRIENNQIVGVMGAVGTDLAPAGYYFLCRACGRRARTRYGFDAAGKSTKIDQGYDESCMMNCVLVPERRRLLFFDDQMSRHVAFQEICESADTTEPPFVWHVQTVRAAIRALEDFQPFHCVFLDHDLDLNIDPDETGMEVATYIAEHLPHAKRPKEIVIHSHNGGAALQMERVLRDAGLKVKRQEFSSGR